MTKAGQVILLILALGVYIWAMISENNGDKN